MCVCVPEVRAPLPQTGLHAGWAPAALRATAGHRAGLHRHHRLGGGCQARHGEHGKDGKQTQLLPPRLPHHAQYTLHVLDGHDCIKKFVLHCICHILWRKQTNKECYFAPPAVGLSLKSLLLYVVVCYVMLLHAVSHKMLCSRTPPLQGLEYTALCSLSLNAVFVLTKTEHFIWHLPKCNNSKLHNSMSHTDWFLLCLSVGNLLLHKLCTALQGFITALDLVWIHPKTQTS